MSTKRLLTPEEIDDIVECIEHSSLKGEISQPVLNARESLRQQLVGLELYPDLIPKFKEEVRKQYFRSLLQPGEMVGVIAASSIGEQNTQASLNR